MGAKDYEDECYWADRLAETRWPGGFHCARCDRQTGYYRHGKRPRTFICAECGSTKSVTAGTLMHRTRLPLGHWFIATLFLARGGTSARKLARFLRVHVETAWQLLHRLRHALPEDRLLLAGPAVAMAQFVPRRPPRKPEFAPHFSNRVAVTLLDHASGDSQPIAVVGRFDELPVKVAARVGLDVETCGLLYESFVSRCSVVGRARRGLPWTHAAERRFSGFRAAGEPAVMPDDSGLPCPAHKGRSTRAVHLFQRTRKFVARTHRAVGDAWVPAYVREHVSRTRSSSGAAAWTWQQSLFAHVLHAPRKRFVDLAAEGRRPSRTPTPPPSPPRAP